MPWYESPTILFVTAAAYWAGVLLDSYSSQHFQWYGMLETNRLWRDADEQFLFKKHLIAAAIIFAAPIVIGYFTNSWGAAASSSMIPGFAFAVFAYNNNRHKKNNRAKQIQILTQLRNDPNSVPDIGQTPIGLGGHTLMSINRKSFFLPFQFLSIQTGVGPGQDATQEDENRVYSAIVNYAKNVEPDKWFKF